MDPLAEATFEFSPYIYAGNCPSHIIDHNGMYSSVDEMIQEAWDLTPSGATGTFHYNNGKMTDYTIVHDAMQDIFNELLYEEAKEQYDLDKKQDGSYPGWLPVEQREIKTEKLSPIFQTVIIIGGFSVKVNIEYIAYKYAKVTEAKSYGPQYSPSAIQSGYEVIRVKGSDGKVKAVIYVDPDPKNQKKYDLGKIYPTFKGYMDASKDESEAYYNYYKKKLEEHIKKYNLDEDKYSVE